MSAPPADRALHDSFGTLCVGVTVFLFVFMVVAFVLDARSTDTRPARADRAVTCTLGGAP